MNKIKFKIEGLTCDACLRLSKIKLGKIEGVKEVQIKDKNGLTEIEADREVSLDEINVSLAGTGYKVVETN